MQSLISSYISGRGQYVEIYVTMSGLRPVICGVLQGSVVGSFLLPILFNDIDGIPVVRAIIFADDACFYVTRESLDEAAVKINQFVTPFGVLTHLPTGQVLPLLTLFGMV